MAIIYAGNSAGGGVSTVDSQSTISSYRKDTLYAPQAIQLRTSVGRNHRIDLEAPITDLWVHVIAYGDHNSTVADDPLITFRDASGNPKIRFSMSNGVAQAETFNGSVWSVLGTGTQAFFGIARVHEYDIHVTIADSGGRFEVWESNIKHLDLTGDTDTNGAASIGQIYFGSIYDADNTYISEIIVADEPTFGMRVKTLTLTADGTTNTLASGDYSGIDEEGLFFDTSLAQGDTDGQLLLCQLEDFAPAGMTPKAVCVSARARRGSTGPQNISLAVRSGGANHFSAKTLDLNFSPVYESWDLNPATTGLWTDTTINALEAGFRVDT